MTEFQKKVYLIVQQIPKGKVATYIDVAIALGDKKFCRAVGNALHINPYAYTKENLIQLKSDQLVPCHRVVNSKGQLALHFGMEGGISSQAALLKNEGVEVTDNKVDLHTYGFKFKD